jgi:VWFA-related protein
MYKKAIRPVFMFLVSVSLVFLTGFTPTQVVKVTQQTTPAGNNLNARITQVDTTNFPKVTVYVSVTDAAGEPVAVSPSRLVLMENGAPVKIDEIGGPGEIGPLATMLVMDVSGSMNSAGKLEAAQAAARSYVDQARPQDLIGLMTFNTKIEYVQPLTGNHQKLMEAIDGLKAKDDTAMYDALARSMEFLEAVTGRKAVIGLTDGLDNRSKLSPQELIQMIGPAGLSISIVGLGDPTKSKTSLSGLNEPALKALAAEAGGVYGYANDAESLRKLYELYGRALQSEYVITYTTPSKLRDGINRSLSVSLSDTETAVGSTGKPIHYNPGGLVPEVATPASWGVFIALLVGVALLLLIPMLFGKVFSHSQARGRVKVSPAKKGSSRIKLKS